MTSSSSAMNGYDVFLSFRGADTRTNFTSHLYNALCKEGVNAFMDKNLKRGDEISSTLFHVIEASKMSIVVFSPNYAASSFCLDELVKIMECKASRGQTVLPVFYSVDPFEVEKQTGNYGIAVRDHESKFEMKKVKHWRSALAEAADLSGWDLRHRDEPEVIREIVQVVSQKLNRGQSTWLTQQQQEQAKNHEIWGAQMIEEAKSKVTKMSEWQNKATNSWNEALLNKSSNEEWHENAVRSWNELSRDM